MLVESPKKLQEAAAWVRSRVEKERLTSFRFTGLVGSKGAIGFVGTGALIFATHTKSIFARELGKKSQELSKQELQKSNHETRLSGSTST